MVSRRAPGGQSSPRTAYTCTQNCLPVGEICKYASGKKSVNKRDSQGLANELSRCKPCASSKKFGLRQPCAAIRNGRPRRAATRFWVFIAIYFFPG